LLKDDSLPRAVILTAIPVEFKAVRAHINDRFEEEHSKGNVYEIGTFYGEKNNWNVLVAEVGAGNAMCCLETERAIDYFNPTVVIFVGIAGGVKDVTYGDVVVAEKAYGYEIGKVVKGGILTRPDLGSSTYGILQRAKAIARNEDWKSRIIDNDFSINNPNAITKAIAAGEKVIATTRSPIYSLIKKHYNDTAAVEMEGYGFYKAIASNEGVQGLIVRGISDMLDNKEETDQKGYQALASKNASAFAFEVLSKLRI